MERLRFSGFALLKKTVTVLTLLTGTLNANAQINRGTEYSPPMIIGPSPTVAGFMRFSDVPVNKYTGIPDISIPLYSVNSHSKEINIDLSLSYHPSGIAYEEEASWVGLGWNLNAGGTISRTMRGMPDELNEIDHYGINVPAVNPYWNAISFTAPGAPADTQGVFPAYQWDISERGRYDGLHDLYQFSFMGHTGRFILTNKCSNPACYQVVKLDNDNAISINYIPASQTFELYDDKGYKFVFNIKEITTTGGSANSTFFDGTSNTEGLPVYTYTSALQLGEIWDRQGNLIVKYTYNTSVINESNVNHSYTYNTMLGEYPNAVINGMKSLCPESSPGALLEPKAISSISISTTATKKLTQIDVVGIATITLTTDPSRQDTENVRGHRLKRILVQNKKGDIIKDIELVHTYSTIKLDPTKVDSRTRMLLKSVKEHYGTKTLTYDMDYMKRKDDDPTKFYIDYWGYITSKPDYDVEGENFRESHPLFCKMDILQKMKIPTGGSVLYDWELNTYSYQGNTSLPNYYANPYNWQTTTTFIGNTTGVSGGSGVTYYDLPYSATVTQKISFSNTVLLNDCTRTTEVLNEDGVWEKVDTELDGTIIIEPGMHYRLVWKFHTGVWWQCPDCGPSGAGTGSCNLIVFSPKPTQFKYLYGGGLRIAKIGYFADDVDPLYYQAGQNLAYYDNNPHNAGYAPPVKEIKFNYNFFGDNTRSSGSLAFAKPIFKYQFSKKALLRCAVDGLQHDYVSMHDYETTTDFNNLSPVRTQGAEVGYKDVRVSETGNGVSRYVFRSPIDVPEDAYTFGRPFLPTSNKDCERGILLQEWQYDEAGNPLVFTDNTYNVVKGVLSTGIDAWHRETKCPQTADNGNQYSGYKSKYHDICETGGNPTEGNNIVFCAYCTPVSDFQRFNFHNEAYAWNQLTQSIVTKYFYDSGVSSEVNTKVLYSYNDINKQVATMETFNSGSDENLKTQYYYYTGPNNHISDYDYVRTYLNGKWTGLNDYEYTPLNDATGRPPYLLSRKSYMKSNVTDFVAIPIYEINKFDIYGNIRSIGYTGFKPNETNYKVVEYGYYDSLPIISVEYSPLTDDTSVLPPIEIPANLLLTAKTASNTGTEQDLITALNAIRTAMPNWLITTYTHKPLVGITSVTDPNGYITRYKYDEVNRLISVTDSDGNIVSENKYKYKYE